MSEKITQLVIHVKQYINIGQNQTDKSLKEIENKIDDKQLQIHDIFSRNLKQVIAHYIQYQDISSNQRRLQNHCEQFSKRIQKAQNLSLYDEQMIQRGEKAMNALKDKKKQLETFRECVRHLKKAANSIQQERYSNAIKHLNIFRENQPQLDTPLKKTERIFNQKIKGHLSNIVFNFWDANRSKMLQIGAHCYNKVELSTNQKTNIYQAFFSRNSTIRNSLIRKSTIQQDSKAGQAPLRFLKKIKDEEILQKIVLRINVEMNSLKQTRSLCKQMKEQGIFQIIISSETNKLIKRICEQSPCQNEADFKKLLSHYIGFLLFKKQIDAFFSLNPESKQTFQMIYTFIGPQANSLSIRPDNISMIIKIKKMLDIFHKVLQILDLDSKLTHSAPLIADLFKQYCNGNLDLYEHIIGDYIKQDNLMGYKPESQYDEKTIEQILKVKPPKGDQTYNFTRFVMFMLQIFNQYYDRMISFVKDTQLNKSQLHDNLSALFQRIIIVYSDILMNESQPLQIAQGQINLHYGETIFNYFSNELQTKHEYMRMTELSYKVTLEARIVDMRTRMRQMLEEKIAAMMANYEQQSTWLPDYPNEHMHQFVQWTLAYVKSLIYELKRINHPAHQEIAFSCFGFICQLYWQYFQECKEFTLLTVYNIQKDLNDIQRYIKDYFYFYPRLGQKFISLSQFNSLMLTNPIQDITQRNKRDIQYTHLDLNQLIPILKKYNKAKNNGNGKIRDLKKKDVQNVVKKLQMEK